jgi:ubiquinone/menaquinone biosynthesis C-methylase UbiE
MVDTIINEMPLKTLKEVILENLPPKAQTVADIGCGTGGTVRFLTRQGATVTGVECGEESLKIARSKATICNEVYLNGVGQNLPLSDQSYDLCCFFFSLHHIPVTAQEKALHEAHRILRPHGKVLIVEPLAMGTGFEVAQPIDDETFVLSKAQEAIRKCYATGHFKQERDYNYLEYYHYSSFEDYKKQIIIVDKDREKIFTEKREEIEKLFYEKGTLAEGLGYRFSGPARCIKLEKL